MPSIASRLDLAVERYADELRTLARRIHATPELCYAEVCASRWLAELCERAGAPVERPFGGLATALRSRAVGRASGPRVAILAEYDALDGLGHACGHNLIAAGAAGAFLALRELGGELPGTVELMGTPAEEGGGGKIRLLEAGAFDGVDAAMMFHPFDRDLLMHTALASSWLRLSFRGTPSHAAMAPHEGRSALQACLDTLRLVDGQRVGFRDGVRVHGVVSDGGRATNIIPGEAACELSVRARDAVELERVKAIVLRCAEGARLASDVALDVEERRGYLDLWNNEPLAVRFGEHARALGRSPRLVDPSVGSGSTDMGDVSHRVPSIHPWLAICDAGETTCHQRAFEACAAAERGLDTMLVAAKGMARTAYDVLADVGLRAAVGEAFAAFAAGA